MFGRFVRPSHHGLACSAKKYCKGRKFIENSQYLKIGKNPTRDTLLRHNFTAFSQPVSATTAFSTENSPLQTLK